jgi:hypothetical protein
LADQTVFPDDLTREIHLRSRGIPRVINGICDNLLLTAFAMGSKVCTLKMLDEVSDDMRLEWPGRRLRPIRSIYEDSYEPSARGERGD